MGKAEIALAGVLGIVGIAMVIGGEIRVAQRGRIDGLSDALFGFGCLACFFGWCGPYVYLVVSALSLDFGSPKSVAAAVGLLVLVIVLIVIFLQFYLRLSDKDQELLGCKGDDRE